jgi:hypothetical protein
MAPERDPIQNLTHFLIAVKASQCSILIYDFLPQPLEKSKFRFISKRTQALWTTNDDDCSKAISRDFYMAIK